MDEGLMKVGRTKEKGREQETHTKDSEVSLWSLFNHLLFTVKLKFQERNTNMQQSRQMVCPHKDNRTRERKDQFGSSVEFDRDANCVKNVNIGPCMRRPCRGDTKKINSS